MIGSGFFPFSRSTRKITNLGTWRNNFLKFHPQQRDGAFDLRTVMDLHDKSATNLRGKIYSLRGLTSSTLAKGIIVGYNKSVERVFIKFTRHLLGNNLRILSTVSTRNRTKLGLRLPSWAPDWSRPFYRGEVLDRYYRFASDRMFCAGNKSMPQVTAVEDSDTLLLGGAIARLSENSDSYQINYDGG